MQNLNKYRQDKQSLICLSLDQQKCDGSGFLCPKAGKIHKEMGSGCQEDVTIYGQFTGAVTPRTQRDMDQTFNSAGLVTTSMKATDGFTKGRSILGRTQILKIFVGKNILHILNFLWLTPVNKELIPKELISFSVSKAAISQRLIDLENLEMG